MSAQAKNRHSRTRRHPSRSLADSTEPAEPPLANLEDGSESVAFAQWTTLWKSVMERQRAKMVDRRGDGPINQR